ncbi:hypothetical protein EJ08DRAFT_693024 [Tothia fuscella]|uniref:Ino eighty subunit 1 n=1 Tax=Tothia fuscella TaxID=1048955 RepID=A0A9P4P1C8_9PEZI|nr:hypothetical protein EJ08DRAFT_693024 [Tothia fuscella]
MDRSGQQGNGGAPLLQQREGEEPDARNSLRHILAEEPSREGGTTTTNPSALNPPANLPPTVVSEQEAEGPSTPLATTLSHPYAAESVQHSTTASVDGSYMQQPEDTSAAAATTSTSQRHPSQQPALQSGIKEEAPQTDDPSTSVPTTPSASAQQPSSTSETRPMYTATTTTTRRNANGSVSSVYSGNKIRHLKKEDGVPLWRKDIQYDFLKAVFDDEQKVFHKVSDKSGGHTFADIYLDAMAKSSKCSKILKDKLLTERPAALNMAMVCLLVNVGRMNTTLNFFPEMRAQLRTYHSIPSLQAHQVWKLPQGSSQGQHDATASQTSQATSSRSNSTGGIPKVLNKDPNAYKQLQDAPRLKSILKGATEDIEQPSSLEDIRSSPVPRTNPVNLIFVLAQFAPKISEMHFDVPRDFFDLVMKPQLSSKSRATAFLWLMWWYLESDFTSEDALRNPYGEGRRSRDGAETDMPIKCPQFEYLNEAEAALENVDTQEEIDFGEIKRKERVAILATDMAPVITGPKRSGKKGKYPRFLRDPKYRRDPKFLRDRKYVASAAAYNQGVGVFSMQSDNDTGSPAQDYNSPAPSQGFAQKLKGSGSVRTDDYDSDRTRSASPTGSVNAQPLPPKPSGGININTLLNNNTPTPPADVSAPIAPLPVLTPIAAAPAPAPAVTTPAPESSANVSLKPKGPGRGNWGYRRKENQANANNTPAYVLASTPGTGISRPRAQPIASEEPDAASFNGASRPHGFYLPLNGAVVEPKRSRPLTSHQVAVERYRKERVDFILEKGIIEAHYESKRKRSNEGALIRTWRRMKALPDGFDSEEEDINLAAALAHRENNREAIAQLPLREQATQSILTMQIGSSNGDAIAAKEGVAARALLMMSSLRPSPWEESDWGEEAGYLASGMRKVRRRTERWESGAPVVRRRDDREGALESMEVDEGGGDGDGGGEERRGSVGGMGMGMSMGEYWGEVGDEDMDEDDEGED